LRAARVRCGHSRSIDILTQKVGQVAGKPEIKHRSFTQLDDAEPLVDAGYAESHCRPV